MINQESGIPCPVCQTTIPFDVNGLMAGMNFSCPNCFASIGLAQESKPIVEDTMEKLNELKSSNKKS